MTDADTPVGKADAALGDCGIPGDVGTGRLPHRVVAGRAVEPRPRAMEDLMQART